MLKKRTNLVLYNYVCEQRCYLDFLEMHKPIIETGSQNLILFSINDVLLC
jgi:hypothetical protein